MSDGITITTVGGLIEVDGIRSIDDVIDALRAFKDHLKLSNTWCDDKGDFADGQTDKVLGPTRAKGLSPFLFQMYHSLFAVKLKMVVDMDQVRRMEARWEGRDTSNVRIDTGRVSKKLIERAKPAVLKDFSKRGNEARALLLTGKHRSDIARKAANSRWRKRCGGDATASARNEREKLRIAAKRKDPAYIAAERERNRARMRNRRKKPEYKALERANGWWQHP